MAATLKPLFDSAFLEQVNHLRLIARRVSPGGRHAEQRSLDLGAGIEFRDFRPYVAGDDLRAIDWNIYRRLGRVFLRLFEEQEDLPLYLMPDVSRSAFCEEPPRAWSGLRATLALAAVALNQHDRVGVFPFAEDLLPGLLPATGKVRLMRIAQHLQALEPGGATDLRRALRSLDAMNLRKGLLAVVSDFFDPAGIDAVAKELRRSRHRLLLVQLVRKDDADPALDGDVRFVDAESGDEQDVSIDAQALERYREAYRSFQEGLLQLARGRDAGYIALDVEEEVAPQLARLFESRRFLA